MSATPDLRFEPERDRDSVGYALGVLRRRWLVVVLAVVACLAVGVVIASVGSDDRYDSSARVLFGTSTLSDAALQLQRADNDPEREAATNVLLAGSEAVASSVRAHARAVHLGGRPPGQDRASRPSRTPTSFRSRPPTRTRSAPPRSPTRSPTSTSPSGRAPTGQSIEAAQRDLRQQLEALPVDAPERQDVREALQRLASCTRSPTATRA